MGAIATAQDSLTVNQPIEREIAPGTAHSYTIHLNAGEYVAGWVDQRGITTLAVIFLPDGSRLRAFAGPPEGKRQFAIVAETAGLYRLEVRAPTTTEAATAGRPIADKGKYELQATEKLSLDERLKLGPRWDRYSSPTIEALRKKFAQGEKSTESFWRKAAESGTPLVEPIEKNDKYVLVTFLWRGTPDTRNVLVVGSFWTRPMTEYVMTQLAGSDVWYLTLRMPGGARFAYALSPNDPLTSDGPRAMQRMATTQSDPFRNSTVFGEIPASARNRIAIRPAPARPGLSGPA